MAEDKNKLLILIEAQLKELKKGLKDAQGEVDKFADGSKEAGDKLDDVEESGKKAGKALGKSGLGKDAKNTATDLGKTAQATEDLQRGLTDLAGGNVGGIADVTSAFKGFGSTLTGTIAIAGTVAAAYGAMIFALYKYGQIRRDQLDENLQWKLATERLETYKESLRGLTLSSLEGAKASGAQIAKINSLKTVIEDVTTSTDDRKRAIDELRTSYPKYFQDLTDEDIKVGNVDGAYQKLKTTLIEVAQARAAQNLIIKATEEKLQLEQQLIQNSAELAKAKTKELAQISNQTQNNISGAYGSVNRQIEEQKQNEGKVVELSEKNLQLITDIQKRQEYIANIAKGISVDGLLGSPDDLGKVGGKIDEIASTITNFGNSFTGDFGLTVPSFEEFVTGAESLTQFGKALDATTIKGGQFNEISQELIDNAPEWSKMLPDPEELDVQVEHIGVALSRVEQQMMTFGDSMANLISGTIASTFTDLGTNIGEALANGESVIGAIGNSLLSSFGAFLGDLGKMLISYGSLAVAKGLIDLALKSGNPIVTIGAGVAAIAVGVALVAVGSAISSRASGESGSLGGGRSTAGSTAGGGSVGSYSGSRASGSANSTGGGTYVFEIEGTKLVGVLSRTLNRNKALGGSLSIG